MFYMIEQPLIREAFFPTLKLPIQLASGGKDQPQSRIPSLDPLDPTQVSTKRDAMNGHACRQIA